MYPLLILEKSLPSLHFQLETSSRTQTQWQTHPHWEIVAQILDLVVMSQTSFTVFPLTGAQIHKRQKEEVGVTREELETKHAQVQSLGNIKMDDRALKIKKQVAATLVFACPFQDRMFVAGPIIAFLPNGLIWSHSSQLQFPWATAMLSQGRMLEQLPPQHCLQIGMGTGLNGLPCVSVTCPPNAPGRCSAESSKR